MGIVPAEVTKDTKAGGTATGGLPLLGVKEPEEAAAAEVEAAAMGAARAVAEAAGLNASGTSTVATVTPRGTTADVGGETPPSRAALKAPTESYPIPIGSVKRSMCSMKRGTARAAARSQ